MGQGFTKKQAQALVNQPIESHSFLGQVPRGARGQVIEAIDVGDHWNVLIEWTSLPFAPRIWYDKFDVTSAMHLLRPGKIPPADGRQSESVEIRSSHDLTATSPDARRSGAHSYWIGSREFAVQLQSWLADAKQRTTTLGLTTQDREQIWISEPEIRKVAAAIKATNYRVVLD